MTTGTILFTAAHIVLFVFTRVKYVRKYKAAAREAGTLAVENTHLKKEVESLLAIVDGYDEDK